ncbi:hypothetical protein Tco_0245541 [Tanacetum coccineum]
MGFDLTMSHLYPSFIEDDTAKGIGLRVADSHTGNHREDGFTPLETIRRFLGIIGSRSLLSSKGRPSSWRGRSGLGVPKAVTKPITHIEEMDFMNFMMEGIDGKFHFEPEGGVGDGRLRSALSSGRPPQYSIISGSYSPSCARSKSYYSGRLTTLGSLETELKQTKLTIGKAIVKLVKKVKKLEDILKRRHVVLTESEDEEPEDQGRII